MADRLFCFVILSSCLRLCASRLLLFWAVDSSERTQETIQANIDHVKDLGIDHDVILAHYRGSRKDWDQQWYKQHVTKSLTGMGYKFHFLQKAYKASDWEKRYEFVWALDSDIDLSKADLHQFLEIARQMDAPIVGPTFVHKGGASLVQMQDSSASVIRREGHSPTRHHSHHGHQVSGPNEMQIPNPGCDFRHTDFVELTAPLLKSAVLKSILVDCQHCIHEKSDWGLDMMWCKYVSERFGEQACALVDKTPVIHLDWGLAPISQDFFSALHAVQAKYGRFWSHHRVLDCKRQEGGLVENIPEETVQTVQDAAEKHVKKTEEIDKKHANSGSTESKAKKMGNSTMKAAQEDEDEESSEEERDVGEGDAEESSHESHTKSSKLSASPKKAAQEDVDEDEDEGDQKDDTTVPEAATKNISAQKESQSNNSSDAVQKVQPAKEKEEAADEESDEEDEAEENQEASTSSARSNITSTNSANTSAQKQAVSNNSSDAVQKVRPVKEKEEAADEESDEEDEAEDNQEASTSSARSNITSTNSANTSAQKQAVSNNSSDAVQKVRPVKEKEEAADEESDEEDEAEDNQEASTSSARSNITSSEGSKSSEQSDGSSQQDDSETSSGIFKVKAKSSATPVANDAVYGDAKKQRAGPGLSNELAVLGKFSAGSKELSSTIDAQGHIALKPKAREMHETHDAKGGLEISFKDAELRLRDDIQQLKKLEEELELSLLTQTSEARQEDQQVKAPKPLDKAEAPKQTMTKVEKHQKKHRAKTQKHSKLQKAVSLIDLDEHMEKLEPTADAQDSPSLQIRALAAGAREVAMEVAEEVQNTVGAMSSEQLASTRNAALQSVQTAIAEQVQKQEVHKDRPNANRQEVSLSHKIRELEAQVAWDQKQMEQDVQEELGLKNKLKQVEAELRARKAAWKSVKAGSKVHKKTRNLKSHAVKLKKQKQK